LPPVVAAMSDAEKVLKVSQEEPAKAFEAAQAAKAAAERSGDQKAKAIASIRLAEALSGMGKAQQAMNEATEAAELCEELRFEEGRGAALALTARICAAHGASEDDAEVGLDAAQDAVRLFRKAGIARGEAVALWSSALAEGAFGRPQQAAKLAKEAMALFQQLADHAGEATACLALSAAHSRAGDLRKASQAATRAAELQAGLAGGKREAESWQAVADIELQAQCHEKALAALAKARAIFQQTKNHAGQASVLADEQRVHLSAGSFGEAMRAAKEAVTVNHDAGDRLAEGRALLRVSELLLENNDVARGQKVAEVAVGILSETMNQEAIAQGFEMLGALKHAAVRLEMENSIMMNADYMHMPKHLVVDPGFSKRLQDSYKEAGKKGMI